MHYTIQELAELKKAMRPTINAQIPMPNIPKKRGGAGRGQGRKPSNGEKKQSKVIRVPLDKLDAVNELLALDASQCNSILPDPVPKECLNLVTKIISIAENENGKYKLSISDGGGVALLGGVEVGKGRIYYNHEILRMVNALLSQITEATDDNQPTPVPITDIKPHHRKARMKYAMTIDGINHYWSGRGRPPKAFNDYMQDHNNGVVISYNERGEFFKRFLIEENEQ